MAELLATAYVLGPAMILWWSLRRVDRARREARADALQRSTIALALASNADFIDLEVNECRDHDVAMNLQEVARELRGCARMLGRPAAPAEEGYVCRKLRWYWSWATGWWSDLLVRWDRWRDPVGCAAAADYMASLRSSMAPAPHASSAETAPPSASSTQTPSSTGCPGSTADGADLERQRWRSELWRMTAEHRGCGRAS